MTEVCVPLSMSSMDHRAQMYQSQMPFLGSYVSPSPSIYPTSYEGSPSMPSTYPVTGIIPSRSPQSWDNQDTTLFSHGERVVAKERRREQNRASQRAYRKRKEDTVKGLYESIKDLRKDSDILRAENTDLKSELKKLHEENRRLRSRASSLRSCLSCTEADVTCSKANPVCSRCEEAGIACNTMPPELESRQATIEASDHEDQIDETPYVQATKPEWYDQQSDVPIIPETMALSGVPAYNITSYDIQDLQKHQMNLYDTEQDNDAIQSSNQQDFSALLQPNARQMYRSHSVGSIAMTADLSRPRSATLYRPPEF